jgi:hypothetical protein
MEGFWPIFFLLVVLKIPVFGALWLVWWASKAPEEDTAEDGNGNSGPRRPFPSRPSGPRRGPHGGANFPPPQRVRPAALPPSARV